jgi:dUTP pyrophosphatase
MEEPKMIDIKNPNNINKTVMYEAHDPVKLCKDVTLYDPFPILNSQPEDIEDQDEEENNTEYQEEEQYIISKNDILFAKLRPDAIIPSKREEDAGFDFYACFDEDYIAIAPWDTVKIPTGLAFACHKSRFIKIEERGSTGTKGIKKSCGVFDSGFRNEWMIIIYNSTEEPLIIAKKAAYEHIMYCKENFDVKCTVYPYEKAIAQGVVHIVLPSKIKEVTPEELVKYKSERGMGMLGSSGK